MFSSKQSINEWQQMCHFKIPQILKYYWSCAWIHPEEDIWLLQDTGESNYHFSVNLNTICKGWLGGKQVTKPRQNPQFRYVVIIALMMFPRPLNAADKSQETMNSAS